MKLTWHIVKKDLRRMAVPVGLWIGFMAVTTAFFGRLPLQLDPVFNSFLGAGNLASGASMWVARMDRFSTLFVLLHGAIAVLLAAHLVQQDGLVGSNGFWQTRPISDGRLFRAKILSAFLLLIVAPAAAMCGVWFSFGFSAAEVLRVAMELSLTNLIVLIPALAIATLTENLGTFLFAAIGALGALLITTGVFRDSHSRAPGHELALKAVIFGGPAVLLLLQYSQRKRRFGWWLYGALLLLAFATRFYTPPVFSVVAGLLRDASRPGIMGTEEERRLVLRLGNISGQKGDLGIRPVIDGAGGGKVFPAVTTLGFSFANLARNRRMDWDIGPQWGDEAALQVLNGSPSRTPMSWEFSIRGAPRVPTSDSGYEFQAAGIGISWVEPHVLWSMPIAVGASESAGSSSSAIVEVQADEGGVVLLVRENDAMFGWNGWPNEGAAGNSRRYMNAIDCFVVTDRRSGTRVAAERYSSTATSLHGVMVSASTLRIRATVGAGELRGWLEQHSLTKVRFVRLKELWAPIWSGRTDVAIPLASRVP